MSRIDASPLLGPHARQGKQALKGEHRELLLETGEARVLKSVDFEAAAAGLLMKHKRWDYLIETLARAAEALHAVEVHEFDQSALRDKKAGTVAVLEAHSPGTADHIRSWQVIVKGALPRQDIIARFKADAQIEVGRRLTISKL
jgi:hypothetical protein